MQYCTATMTTRDTNKPTLRSAATIFTLLLSSAALGVSIWSVVQSERTADRQVAEAARAAAVARAENVVFTGGTTSTKGRLGIAVHIANYNTLPVYSVFVLWPGHVGREYPRLDSCEEYYLTATTDSQSAGFRYLNGAVLFYQTPDGRYWARRLDGVPYAVKSLPAYSFDPATATTVPSCHPS
jgi:hypothetical protein